MPATYAEILELTISRKGAGFTDTLERPKPVEELNLIPDDRWLSIFAKRIFQAGFNWQVVEDKWPRFEEVFHGFDIGRNSMMSDDDLDTYLKTDGIVRHATKILSIRDNAIFLRELAEKHGSAARHLAEWPAEDYAGLLWFLKQKGSRLGGHTGMYALRPMGLDGWILSRDVGRALIREGVVDGEAKSRKDLNAVQAVFNAWRAESGEPFMVISKVLAASIE